MVTAKIITYLFLLKIFILEILPQELGKIYFCLKHTEV